ncbi:unnamed protein product [Ambrosiozyma monospora]|uniref:Unnamed protein product n=1 Tax=Ambrosiozyma monospora TaxID=43982 RepID=A0ACB5T6S6_AMBMO|nr:unnamed protein product [Ambrosiozyma monospora]
MKSLSSVISNVFKYKKVNPSKVPKRPLPQKHKVPVLSDVEIRQELKSRLITVAPNLTPDERSKQLEYLFKVTNYPLQLASDLLEVPGLYMGYGLIDKVLHNLKDSSFTNEKKIGILSKLFEKFNRENISLSSEHMNFLYEEWQPFANDGVILAKLKESNISPASKGLLIHHYILNNDYDSALRVFRESFAVDLFISELLAFHLLSEGRHTDVFRLIEHLHVNNAPYMISQQLLHTWLDQTISDADCESLVEFLRFSSLTDPYIILDESQIEQISQLLLNNHEHSTFAKMKNFSEDKSQYDGYSSLDLINIKRKRQVLRFEGYVSELGAKEALLSGYFSKLKLHMVHGLSPLDFPTFIESLSSQVPKLSLSEALTLIEQMHGYHLEVSKNAYSPLLHPDEQLVRYFGEHLSDVLLDAGIIKRTKTDFGKPVKVSNKTGT